MPIITFVDHTIPVAADLNDSYSFINTEVRTYERGGTGLSSYTKGDILYASAANTVAKLGIGGYGQTLAVASTGIPTWTTRTLYKSGTDITHAAGTIATVFGSAQTLKANSLGTANRVRATIQAVVTNNTGAGRIFTYQLTYGVVTNSLTSDTIPTGTTNGIYSAVINLYADNATNTQFAVAVTSVLGTSTEFFGPASTAYGQDSTADKTLDILMGSVAVDVSYTIKHVMVELVS